MSAWTAKTRRRWRAWWQRLVGGEMHIDADGDVALRTGGVRLLFLAVPDTKRGKNRLHVDLRATNFESAVGAALALGARAPMTSTTDPAGRSCAIPKETSSASSGRARTQGQPPATATRDSRTHGRHR